MLHMSAQCYKHRFGYCTNAKTCFNVHFRPILAERRVLLWQQDGCSRSYLRHSIFAARFSAGGWEGVVDHTPRRWEDRTIPYLGRI